MNRALLAIVVTLCIGCAGTSTVRYVPVLTGTEATDYGTLPDTLWFGDTLVVIIDTVHVPGPPETVTTYLPLDWDPRSQFIVVDAMNILGEGNYLGYHYMVDSADCYTYADEPWLFGYLYHHPRLGVGVLEMIVMTGAKVPDTLANQVTFVKEGH